MKDILFTRLLLWKKKRYSMLFWLILPAVGTYLFITTVSTIQDDSKIPIGVVIEDDSILADQLLKSIQNSPLVHAMTLSEEIAISELEKHELDSVFVIHEGYEKAILDGKRNDVISSYRTDLSLAYSPVKEMIVSLVQEESGRSKAAHFIQNMAAKYGSETTWSWDEINKKSKEVQVDENLLNTAFTYSEIELVSEEPSIFTWSTWEIWAILSLLSTLFLTDWVIRERQMSVAIRYSFFKFSQMNLYVKLLLLYLVLFLLFDLLSIGIFVIFMNETISISFLFELVSFRIMLCLLSFSIAQCFRKVGSYYSFTFMLTLILGIISGAVIPIQGIVPEQGIVTLLNPIHAFINGEITILWNVISIVLVILYLVRKETTNIA
ncbi:ABC transporter permease [Ornithinibacillus scapharcae]|uniref:ABC transporter permease n=1 Tax=Ornithinibacillus scapharcae TaxID=1147159 RepID=UPI000225C04D|nr:ABC transporter permease [Ornithinibacillus scapharcae]